MSGKAENFIKNFKPLTQSDIAKQIQAKEDAKKNLATETVALEAELDNFNKMESPLLHPITKKAMCWVRTPLIAELEAFTPPELLIYKGKEVPEDVQKEVAAKNNDLIFQMMEAFITNPKRTAAEWKVKGSNPVFIKLFYAFLDELVADVETKSENFR